MYLCRRKNFHPAHSGLISRSDQATLGPPYCAEMPSRYLLQRAVTAAAATRAGLESGDVPVNGKARASAALLCSLFLIFARVCVVFHARTELY